MVHAHQTLENTMNRTLGTLALGSILALLSAPPA